MNSGTQQVDENISRFPPKTQKLLQQLRAIIRKAASDAEVVISYALVMINYVVTFQLQHEL
jgi:uncharacterized protein YdhG (YjbR/CyaY superfamily)